MQPSVRNARFSRLFGCWCLVAVVTGCTSKSAAPSSRTADTFDPQEVLSHLVGEWETEAVAKRSISQPKEVHSAGRTSIQWVLGGKFLRSSGRQRADGHEDIQFFSYDGNKKAFRHWYFDSGGAAGEETGQWDPERRLLTWTAEWGNEITMTNEVIFVDANAIVWTLFARDKQGNVHVHMEGRMKKVKE
jgi:hypothetical protein